MILLAGILLIFAMACESDSSSASTTASSSDKDVITPAYEPRSFDEVKPQNVDLKLVPAPALPEIPDCTGGLRTSG
jgi:hypothetical protein